MICKGCWIDKHPIAFKESQDICDLCYKEEKISIYIINNWWIEKIKEKLNNTFYSDKTIKLNLKIIWRDNYNNLDKALFLMSNWYDRRFLEVIYDINLALPSQKPE